MKAEAITLPLTRTQKSAQTRQKIIDSAALLLRQYGYEQLTVRNICSVASVSNGTFYHFFDSKDDLMGEYLRQSQQQFMLDVDQVGLMEYIILGYLNLVDDYLEMGVEFTANFYTAKNQAFNLHTRKPGNYMSDLYYNKLSEAQRCGDIHPGLSVDGIVHDIQVIVIGNIFEWCVVGGVSDLKSDLSRMLRGYFIDAVFTPAYFQRYPLN